ncbi:MAG TPA: PAS domain S-box protein [Verrucomicrobiae bacterium]|nr:PAS domain S-box protein [Verrucomicrobiae bacterium]
MKRLQLYILLLLFGVIAVLSGSFLSYQLAAAHRQTIDGNRQWVKLLSLCDKLDEATTEANAPAINLTQSGDPKSELARVNAADQRFDKVLDDVRRQLPNNARPEETAQVQRSLSSIAGQMNVLVTGSKRIISLFQADRTAKMDGEVSVLNDEYSILQKQLDGFRTQLRGLRSAFLERQAAYVTKLERLQMGFGWGMLLTLAAGAWYGWRLENSLWRSEAARQEAEGRSRVLVENISDVIMSCDERGITKYVSPSIEHILGYKPEELIGRDAFEHVHPEDAAPLRKGFLEAVGKPGHTEALKYRYRHKDGSWRILECVGKNLLEEPGICGMVVYCHDATVRLDVQSALIESEEHYRLLFDQSVDGVMLADEDGNIINANPALCQLLGYTREEMIRLKVTDTYISEELAGYEQRRALGIGESRQFCRRIRRKDGSYFEAEVNLIHVKGCIQSVVRDITERQRAQQALEASETKYRLLVEHSQDGILSIGLDRRITYANDKAAQVLGYSRTKMLGMPAEKTYPPGHRMAGLDHYGSLGVGEATQYQREAMRGDGTTCIIDVTLFRVNETMYQATFRDVTGRVRAEEKTRLQTAALEAAANAIMIADGSGTIAWVNPAFTALTGYTASEAVGQNPRLLKSGRQDRAFYEKMWETIRAGRAWSGQLTNRRKDGSLYREQMTITPVTDGRGAITHYVSIKTDISETHKFQQELRESQEQLNALVGAAQDAMIMFDSQGQITLWNQSASRIFGCEAAEALGKSVYQHILASRCQTDLERRFAALCHDDKNVAIGQMLELTGVRKSGHEFPVEIFLASVQLNGAWHGVGTFRDISKRKLAEVERVALELQLRHGQKMEAIGQLSAGIAHEINTPTQYIGDNVRFVQEAVGTVNPLLAQYRRFVEAARAGAITEQMIREAELAMAGADLDYMMAEVPKAIQESLEGIGRVSKIVHAMKEFSHPGTKDKTLTDLNAAIESTLTVCRNEWKYVAEVETDYDPNLPLVPCLVGEFNQVTLNLIVNAAHAIADVVGDGKNGKGRIRVSTRRVGDWAEVRIGDTGTGIPQAIRSRVFDPFFTTKSVGKGSGQGLAIAHSVVVDKHGGNIHFETEVGKGTTFIIRLPLGDSVTVEEETHHETANTLRG